MHPFREMCLIDFCEKAPQCAGSYGRNALLALNGQQTQKRKDVNGCFGSIQPHMLNARADMPWICASSGLGAQHCSVLYLICILTEHANPCCTKSSRKRAVAKI